MNPHDDRPQRARFEDMARADIVSELAAVHARLRLAKIDLCEAIASDDQSEVKRLMVRTTKLQAAAERAQAVLSARAEQRRAARAVGTSFIAQARRELPPEAFRRILDAALAA